MNISVKETTVFSVFHPDAQDLYNTCSDLKKLAWELWDPSFRLNDEVILVIMFLLNILTLVSQEQKCSTFPCLRPHALQASNKED